MEKLSELKNFKVEEERDGTLHALLGKTSLSFFYYNYPVLSKPVRYHGLYVAGLKDIGLMKLAALTGRGSRKDFIDLYFLSEIITIEKLIKYSGKKFKNQRDFQIQVLKALVYFDDAENEPMPLMHKKITWEKIKQFFTRETRTLTYSLK